MSGWIAVAITAWFVLFIVSSIASLMDNGDSWPFWLMMALVVPVAVVLIIGGFISIWSAVAW